MTQLALGARRTRVCTRAHPGWRWERDAPEAIYVLRLCCGMQSRWSFRNGSRKVGGLGVDFILGGLPMLTLTA